VLKTTWIRQAIEMSLAVPAADEQPISRDETLRALTLLRPPATWPDAVGDSRSEGGRAAAAPAALRNGVGFSGLSACRA
jgi:hypothetical protein